MMASHSSVLFREIHKNAWLRKLPLSEKKSGATPKKGEKVWTVFCVHDDTEPFLELYSDQKMATAHRPETTVALGGALHVSPTICPQDDEFEFVITLPSDLIRLTAPSWDVMMDWVDSLCSKLREMHILSPKENIYSRNPEARPPLLPTRDPNSPLPLPPPGSSSLMPGVEITQILEQEFNTGSLTLETTQVQVPQNVSLDTSENIVSVTVETPSIPDLIRARSTINQGENESRDNVTVIEVSSEPISASSGTSVFDFSFVGTALDQEEEFFTPPLTPVLPRASIQRRRINSTSLDSPRLVTVVSTTTPILNRQLSEQSSEGVSPEQSERVEDSLYEHVFLTTPSPSPANYRPQVSRGRTKFQGRTMTDRMRIGESSGASQTEIADRSRCVASDRETNDRRIQTRNPALQPPPQPFSRGMSSDVAHRLTLREQQVLQLRKEMLHSGGVRLQLRRKDCIGSIALIDAFSAVWVAGWKQRDHPMLYNALHIGDQLVSVAGILVQNANDAQRLIRGAPSLYVELIVRRVPCGRVYALRRDSEGQDLGILQEGKTAEIKEISPGSIAALGGMSSRTPTLDGLSLTNCVLTEINGRPLNLFFKDNEVRDRLNSVGLDISLLVQPLDLIKQIKKQLKSMKNYKDYIVQ